MDGESRSLVIAPGSHDMLMDPDAFEHGQRVAKLFATSELVPPHLRGKTADCFIALYMAKRLNEDPLTVMQNIHFISGKAGWNASYMIGRANRSGAFRDPITWETVGAGDNMAVTAKAVLANGTEVDATASMEMARAEGWVKNAKYKSMPEHMLRYRSATFLIRLYAPEVMMGFPAADENEDVAAARGPEKAKDITPPRPRREDFVDSPVVRDQETGAPASNTTEDSPEVSDRAVASDAQESAQFAVIDSDGEVREFAVPQDAAKHLCSLLSAATKAGNIAIFEGCWQSNELTREQLMDFPDVVGPLTEFYLKCKDKLQPSESDPLALPAFLDRRGELGS